VEEFEVVLGEGIPCLKGGVDATRVPGGNSPINKHPAVPGFTSCLLASCLCLLLLVLLPAAVIHVRPLTNLLFRSLLLGDAVILPVTQKELPLLLVQGCIPEGLCLRGQMGEQVVWSHAFRFNCNNSKTTSLRIVVVMYD